MAQAVRRSPPTAGVPSSRLAPPCGFRGGRNGVCVGFSRGFSRVPLPQISFHHFSTLISSISFHFICPCDGASGVVGRHPCYSRTHNIGASSHLIPRPDLVLDTSWGYFYKENTLEFQEQMTKMIISSASTRENTKLGLRMAKPRSRASRRTDLTEKRETIRLDYFMLIVQSLSIFHYLS